MATRAAGDDELLARLATTLQRILAGGVTTLEVKSGYGLTVGEELRGLELLQRARSLTPMQLAITFLGAHVVPRDLDGDADERGDRYTDADRRGDAAGGACRKGSPSSRTSRSSRATSRPSRRCG